MMWKNRTATKWASITQENPTGTKIDKVKCKIYYTRVLRVKYLLH